MNVNDQSDPRLEECGDQSQPDTADNYDDPTVDLELPMMRVEELAGKVIGEYKLIELIGSGSGGRVYKAQHRHMERIVAVKVLSQSVLSDTTQLKRFKREVRAAARLLNPNIVTAFDAGEFQSMYYLVMEYVDGDSFATMVHGNGPLPVRKATEYVIQVAQGLVYAHSEGVVHRDIKPENLMLNKSGEVKILDLGLARLHRLTAQNHEATDPSAELTVQGMLLGTVGYISPEQINDASSVDERTDIYSLGCTFYFLLTGQAPYAGSIIEVLKAHAEAPVPHLANLGLDIPHGLDAVFRRMLAKNPIDRQTSMRELIRMLDPFVLSPFNEKMVSTDEPQERDKVSAHTTGSVGSRSTKLVGFDMGTRNAYVSSLDIEGSPIIVSDRQGSIATPAALLFEKGAFQVGQSALKVTTANHNGFSDRLFTRLGTDESVQILEGHPFPVEVLASILIHKVKKSASHRIGHFNRVSYTIPGCYGYARRRAYKTAFDIASCETLGSVNASTAVAIQFSYLHGWLNPSRYSSPKQLLVFRYGAGSFDATVYRVKNRKLIAVAMTGDTQLGECAWVDRIVEHVVEQIENRHGAHAFDYETQLFLLNQQCEAAMESLSQGKKNVSVQVKVDGIPHQGMLSQRVYKKIGTSMLARAEQLTSAVLSEAGVSWNDLDHVLLAGSVSQMPVVRDMVKKWAGNRQICSLAGPDVASGGAVLFAKSQSVGRQPMLDFHVQDVVSHEYGIRCNDPETGASQTTILINRNTPLPIKAKGNVTKGRPDQKAIEFQVVESSDSNIDHAVRIGDCRISNLPPGLPTDTPVDIEFSLDSTGILSIFVESPATGQRYAPDYRAAIGMDDRERVHWKDWMITAPICD